MRCEQVRQLWMDDELNPVVRRHLAQCGACRDATAEQAALLRLMDEWAPRRDVPAGFDARLHQRIRAAEASAAQPPAPLVPSRGWKNSLTGWTALWNAGSRAPRLALATGALCSLLLVSAGVLYHTGHPQPKPPLPVTQVAKSDPVVRDLQVLDQDSDMLESVDFLNGSSQNDPTQQQTEIP